MRAIVFALLLVSSSACVGLVQRDVKAPEVAVKSLVTEPLPVTTAPEAIVVYTGMAELPRGFFYYSDRANGEPRYKLFAVPAYPSADGAQVVVAGMGTKERRGVYGREAKALLEEYKRKASELGANALFVTTGGPGLVFAIIVNDAPAPASGPAANDLLKSHQRELTGYKAVGTPLALSLAGAEWDMDTKEAHCYALAVALEPGADLSTDAQAALYLELQSNDGLLGNRSYGGPKESIANPDGLAIEAPRHGKFIAMRSYATELGCAKGPARAHLRLWTKGKNAAIGQGNAKVALYQKTISKQELAKRVKESDARWEQARIEAEAQRREDERRDAERERERERERAERDAARNASRNSGGSSGSTGGGAASTYYSLSLKNDCRQTVRLFIGDKPKYGSGRTTTVSSNSITSYSGSAPETIWIVDSSDNGLSAFTVSPGRHSIRILQSCTGFVAN